MLNFVIMFYDNSNICIVFFDFSDATKSHLKLHPIDYRMRLASHPKPIFVLVYGFLSGQPLVDAYGARPGFMYYGRLTDLSPYVHQVSLPFNIVFPYVRNNLGPTIWELMVYSFLFITCSLPFPWNQQSLSTISVFFLKHWLFLFTVHLS